MSEVTRKMRNQFIRIRNVGGAASGAFAVEFRYTDRWKAQAVTRDLMNHFMNPQHTTQVLDPASLPASPSSPNRLTIVLLGTVAGILLGLAASRFRRPGLAAA